MKAPLFLMYFVLFLVSCKEEVSSDYVPTQYAKMKLNLQFNGEELKLNEIVQMDDNRFRFERVAFFTSEIKLDNKQVLDAAFFNAEDGNDIFLIEKKFDEAGELSFNIGVNEELNHQDPAAFDNNHPLNITNVDGLHWGWNPGYVFVAIEGKVDTISDDNLDNFDHSFIYHVGNDDNLTTKSFNNISANLVQDSITEISLNLDLNDFLDGSAGKINVRTENSMHGGNQTGTLADKVVANFNEALTK